MKGIIALEDGKIFSCKSFTGEGEVCGEIVFNTSMTGYQEILTDPSYKKQLVTMTYPLIGNYGVNQEDCESLHICAEAIIVREYTRGYSNHRAQMNLADYLKKENVMGVEDVDTRAITRYIREKGSMRCVISTKQTDEKKLVQKAQSIPSMKGADLVSLVSTKDAYFFENNYPVKFSSFDKKEIEEKVKDKFFVIAIDYGIKFNIIKSLENKGCKVLVLPATSDFDFIKSMNPDGIFLSNGPGDPSALSYLYDNVKKLVSYKPVFGICLGHQILSIAFGAKTFKMKFGHRGANHPVKNLDNQKIEISSQNHGFAVDPDSLEKANLKLSHINLNDNTVEGFQHKSLPVFAVQYHPEASPGPHDSSYLFENFVNLMKSYKKRS